MRGLIMDYPAAMSLALEEARLFVGRTAPNPPVGAVALSASGDLLGKGAHVRAGQPHAEVVAIRQAQSEHPDTPIHTLVVTLEPCNHFGRTPPCCNLILESGVSKVVLGQRDPNPRVEGHGIERLRAAGVEVVEDVLSDETAELIQPFRWFSQTGRPWVVLKTAHHEDGGMLPPLGQKTFTSESALVFAHQLRKRSNAIITGSGTVLADQPELTVRKVSDHPGVERVLVVLDRRARVAVEWLNAAQQRGFKVWRPDPLVDLDQILEELGRRGCMEVLVEAGPSLSASFLKTSRVNLHYKITAAQPDRIEKIVLRT